MRIDRRIKHDIEVGRRGVELFVSGRGYESVSASLSASKGAVRRRHQQGRYPTPVSFSRKDVNL